MTDEDNLTFGSASLDPAVEKIKLFKNTKGYNWEIQLCAEKNKGEKAESLLERLSKINAELNKAYGFDSTA